VLISSRICLAFSRAPKMQAVIEACFVVSKHSACTSAVTPSQRAGSPSPSGSSCQPSPCADPTAESTRCHRRSALTRERSSIKPILMSISRAVCSARSRYRLVQYKLSATRESIPPPHQKLATNH
jgi:hypothetical protein